MSGILLLATIILGALLFDARRRLTVLERDVASRMATSVSQSVPPPAETAEPAEPVGKNVPAWPLTHPINSQPEPPLAFAPTATVPALEAAPEAAGAIMRGDEAPKAGLAFEDLFGRKLPIWAGAITLIVAAVLMVKYSIDTGLLSPIIRVMLGFLFSAGLVGIAELARSRERFVQDVRVGQALAGAGVGGLYAATLAAANLYGLIGPGLAFAGLSAITALALGLALRFGAPCAVLGLIGGVAAPAMVQSDSPSVPLLAGYLAVIIGAITLLSRRQRWVWLGLGALTGGAGWTLFTIALGGLDQVSTLSMGLLVLLLALGLPALTVEGPATPLLRAAAAVVGALQLALLVAAGDFAPLTWALYGLLSLAFVSLAGRTPVLRKSVPVPLLTALVLAGVWPTPDLGPFVGVIVGIVAIYGGYSLRHLWRHGGLVQVGMLGAISLGGYALCCFQFYHGQPGQDLRFALVSLAFALLPAIGAALGWRDSERRDDARFALLAIGSGLLVVLSGLIGLPEWSAPIVFALVASALLMLAVVAGDQRLSKGALGFLAGAVGALVATVETGAELERLVHVTQVPHVGRAICRWGVVALAAGGFAFQAAGTRLRFALQPLAVLVSYGLVAQVVPASWLPVASAIALVLLAEAARRRQALELGSAQITLAVLLVLWALEPLAYWLVAGVSSFAADPVLASALPSPSAAIRRLIVPALAAAFTLSRGRAGVPCAARTGCTMLGGVLGLAGAHVLYKQVFMLADAQEFVRLGLAERCLWDAGLLAAGMAAARWLGARSVALALVVAGLGHCIAYTLVLHNPLWAQQAVGNWPIVNLLLPAFGIAFIAPTLITRLTPENAERIERPADILRMIVVLLFALATLRQLFAGNVLVFAQVGEVENIGRSVLAIALALGFLAWGIRKGLRDWRIASLALMLAAVAKVFLFDASGLQGLLRIGSFLALGFSLIGLGWLYSRYLKPDAPGRSPPAKAHWPGV